MKPEHREFNRMITRFEKLALSVGADFCKGVADDDCPGGSLYKLQVLNGVSQLVNGVTHLADLQAGSMMYHISLQFMLNTTCGDFETSHEVAMGFTQTLADEMNRFIDTPDDEKDHFEWFEKGPWRGGDVA